MSGRKGKTFVGHKLTRPQSNVVTSLILSTCGRLGVHKKFFKNEESFWAAIAAITGIRREAGEDFFHAVLRARRSFMSRHVAERDMIISAIDKRQFLTDIGMKLQETVSYSVVERRRKASESTPSVTSKNEFYASWEWRTLRMEVLKEQGRACQCCGAEPGMKTAAGDPVRICVDHIKPLSKFWHLRLDKNNLQVLCDECNQGKGNWDQTDFRQPAAPDEWVIEDHEMDRAIVDQLSYHGGTIQ